MFLVYDLLFTPLAVCALVWCFLYFYFSLQEGIAVKFWVWKQGTTSRLETKKRRVAHAHSLDGRDLCCSRGAPALTAGLGAAFHNLSTWVSPRVSGISLKARCNCSSPCKQHRSTDTRGEVLISQHHRAFIHTSLTLKTTSNNSRFKPL